MCLYFFKRRWLGLKAKYKTPIKVNESNDLSRTSLQCAFPISKENDWGLVTKYKKQIKVNESNALIKTSLQCAFTISKENAQTGWLNKRRKYYNK